jgi:hypothetical protein
MTISGMVIPGTYLPHEYSIVNCLHLNLDIHTGGKIEAHQRIHGLGCRINDVNQSLMDSHFELFPRILVHKRGADYGILALFRRQRYRTTHLGATTFSRVDYRPGRLVDDFVIIRPNLYADALFIISGLVGNWIWHGIDSFW